MMDMVIGPGQPCWQCGGTYGLHDKECSNKPEPCIHGYDIKRGSCKDCRIDALEKRINELETRMLERTRMICK